jgi:hypothetical protein
MSKVLTNSDEKKFDNIELSTYIDKLCSYQERILQLVHERQNKLDNEHTIKGNKEKITEFPINSFVLVKYETTDNLPPSKLHPLLRGPYKIINKVHREEGDIYTCQDLVTNKLYDFHVKLLSPYLYDTTRINPMHTALKDHNSSEKEKRYIIERIISHRFIPKERIAKNLQLLVKWSDENDPQWNSFNETTIKKVELVHNYLYEHHLGSFVPQKFKRTLRKRKERIVNELESAEVTHANTNYYLRRQKRRTWRSEK